MSTRSSTPSDYRTTDLYLAAYLKTAGVEMKRTDRDDGGRVYFVFDTSVANIEELKAGWFNSTGRVVANTYAYHVKNLKSLCHSRLAGQGRPENPSIRGGVCRTSRPSGPEMRSNPPPYP